MRSLVAFIGAVTLALLNVGIAVLYSVVAILICQLIWQSKASGTYMFLWGLSFASYTLPKLVDKVFEKLEEAQQTMLNTREQCVCQSKNGHTFNFAGAYLERIKIGHTRQCFYSSGIDENGFIFKEWEDDFTIVVFLTKSGLVVYWGKTLAKLVTWWVPRMIQIDYKINWKDRKDDTMTSSALRRRDIMALHKLFEDFGRNQALRPLMEHQTRLAYRTTDLDAIRV